MSEDEITFEGRPITELSRDELCRLIRSMAATLAMQHYLIERMEGREPWPVAGSA